MSQIKAGIINVTGYAGSETARLLYRHKQVKLAWVTGRSAAGKKLGEVFPHLADINLNIDAEPGDADVVFSALPHKSSAEAVIPLLKRGCKIIDISADFRLKNADVYTEWYGEKHPAPELLQEAVYGLTELNRGAIKTARLVANPGCYPTGTILGLTPVLKKELIQPENIIVDAKSGVSGAGRTLTQKVHYAEENESISAYSLAGHRHLPEIVQELKAQNTRLSPSVTFVPHLTPMTRGILSTCYARLAEDKIKNGKASLGEITNLYHSFYHGEPFVRVVDNPPATKQVWGSNYCLIYVTIDVRTQTLIVISCIDNLVKGAAGQAVQNMNVMCGFAETEGINALPLYP